MAEKEYFLYIEGKRIEVTEEVYREYYQGERRKRYFTLLYRKDRLWHSLELKRTRTEAGTANR